MSATEARIRCILIGLFYGAYMLALDRCINLKGGANITVLVAMSIIAFIITIGTIKVPKESRHHMPMKPFAILSGFIISVAVLYAFFGAMAKGENFLRQVANAHLLPPAVQLRFEGYLDWSDRHALTGRAAPVAKP